MKKTAIVVTVIALGLFGVLFPEHSYLQEKPQTWEVYFSPRGGCTEAIIREIERSKSSILIQAYEFRSEQIATALLEAHKRGIHVDVILDKRKSKEENSKAALLHNNGIPVRIDSRHSTNHNKVIVIDEETVITGSFNFTKNAEERNAENLLIIHDKDLATEYIKNWKDNAKNLKIYNGTGK